MVNMLRYWMLCMFFACGVLISGCGGGSDGNVATYDTPKGELISGIFPYTGMLGWDDTRALASGTKLYVLTNDAGTGVYKREVQLISAGADNGNDQIAILPQADQKLGPGDSGSPVVTADGKLVAAVWSGYDAKSVYARSFSQMLQLSYSGRGRGGTTPPRIPWVLKGAPSSINLTHFSKTGITPISGQVSSSRAVRDTEFAPGRKYVFFAVYGPEVELYGSATLTDYSPQKGGWIATGHAIDDLGPRRLPVAIGTSDFRLLDGSVVTRAMGAPTHTLAFDGQFGSLIKAGAPAVGTLEVKITMPGKPQETITHFVCRDNGQGAQGAGTYYGLLIPVANRLGSALPASWDIKAKLTYLFDGMDGKTESIDFELPTDFHQDALRRLDNLVFGKLLMAEGTENRDLISATLTVEVKARDPLATPAPSPTPPPF